MEWFSTSRHFVLERFVDKKKLINPILKKGRRHTSKENGEVLFFIMHPELYSSFKYILQRSSLGRITMDRISFEKDDQVDVFWLINQLFFSFSRRKRFDGELWWSKIRFVVKIFRSRLLSMKISFKYKWDSALFQQGSFENWKKIDQKPYFHKSLSTLTKLQHHSCNINLSNSGLMVMFKGEERNPRLN